MTVAAVEIPNKALFSRKEVCRLLGIDRRTFSEMVHSGLLTAWQPPGFSRKCLVTRQSVVNTLEAIGKPAE